jgi:hypothetical protein
LALRVDGVFAVSVRIPGGRAPTPSPGNELGAMLLEEDFDALGAVDLADARQLVARQVPDLDGYLHPASLPREGNCCSHERLLHKPFK